MSDSINWQRPFVAAILTPYLVTGPEEFIVKHCLGSSLYNQIKFYGYNPDNFSNIDFLKTAKGREVFLDKRYYGNSHISLADILSSADVAITGCGPCPAKAGNELKENGMIAARYSIFYGHENEYTGARPEEEGYSFDIPKDINIVKKFLTDDGIVNALIARKESKIKKTIDILNKKLPQPILVTPRLTEALKISRSVKRIYGSRRIDSGVDA